MHDHPIKFMSAVVAVCRIATTAVLLSCFSGYACAQDSDKESMRMQADRFLEGMPSGMQQRQAAAIRNAIAGDSRDLQSVRNSRNAVPQLSDNVRTVMLAPSLRLYEPIVCPDSKQLPLLIYFHGGGWTFGSLNSCGRFCDAMAASGKMKVLAVDYRLAPEHPFPEGLDDCVDAIEYAVRNSNRLNIDPAHISVGGDSSGGNLAIASVLSDRCAGMIESLVLFYPVTKAFADNSLSWQKYGEGYGLDAEIMDVFNRAYAGDVDPYDERISVGMCDSKMLERIPRTLLVAAGRDILCDQGREFAAKVGSRLMRIEFPDAVHLFITVPGQDKAFGESVSLATDFILNR
jgi:acetyl esterase